jgi:thioredoxin-dependent peroxiredoxin
MSWWRARPGLKPGDPAPDFDRMDEEGKRHTLADFRGRWLVVFFYPRDNTPVCVREACAFNEQWEQFQELGADILGCSGQDAASHKAMSAACRLRYRLLCDEDRAMREAWGVPQRLLGPEKRSTYLVDPGSRIRYVFSDPFRGEDHATLTLQNLRAATAQAG